MYPQLKFAGTVIEPTALRRRVEGLADHLYEAGIRPDDVVALMLRNEPAFFEIILACQLVGAYFCPINWHFLEDEAAHILEDSGAKLLFIHQDLVGQIGRAAHRPGLVCVVIEPPALLKEQYGIGTHALPPATYESWTSARPGLARPRAEPRGAMPYTSGSTGRPKGVLRRTVPPEKAQEAQALRRALGQLVFGITGDSVALLAAPLYHSAPLSYGLFCAAEGATLHLESKFDARSVLAQIEAERITHAYLVPTMYQRLLQLDPAERVRFDVSSLQFVASTGSPCAAATKRAMIEWFGPVINEAYAASETGYITFIDAHESLRRPGSAGRAALGASIRILDEEGRELPAGAVGLIYAHQPAYPDFTYINKHSARSAMERDGLVTLGDMGYLDAEGYLFVCDRSNDMVISGGVNIYPAEIEAVINQLEGVVDSAVFGIPDVEFGEALCAAIQLQPGKTLSEAEVRTHLLTRLARFKVPRTIAFHETLPREDTGKIFKRLLRAPYWEAAGRSI